MRVYCTR